MGTFDQQTGDPKSLATYFSRIDILTAPQTEQEEPIKDITKRHWKPQESRSGCLNTTCRKQFSLIERPHHCRRCGEIFCSNCVKFRRKLNKLANPDPDGKTYKVCQKCYDEGRVTEGCIRNLTEEFRWLRAAGKNRHAVIAAGQRSAHWRERLNLEKEFQRLVDGFQTITSESEMKRTLQEVRSMVSVPEWQKSSVWIQEQLADSCQVCRSKFGVLRKKVCCKVCGIAVCKSCSSKDLLVFLPDNQDGEPHTSPKLAIIKIKGCPEVEPEISLYLRTCGECREKMIDKQIANLEKGDDDLQENDFLSKLNNVHHVFYKVEVHINKHLPEYQEIVDSLHDNSRGTNLQGSDVPPKSNMKTLAKSQEDLSDFLAQHVMTTQQLKRLKPQSSTQSKLMKNYIRSKCDFYLENMAVFRGGKRKLESTSPPEVLEFIQKIMDTNAIVSTHLYVRQLVYEALGLCAKFHLPEDIPKLLTPVEQVIENDVKTCVIRDGEDWEHHQETTQQLIKTQIKDHKLIRPSRTYLRKYGAQHADEIMRSRSQEVVTKVLLQLNMKSANRRFPSTKKALEEENAPR
ncbi:vacuolar segregation protein PEP7-like isoform X2 [Gigantopelta aegis]|uniref:vacuolar segregation protein PEP7-like isoform X2 n=1 Tax=Gigantopelta aegis TaxID=1735272 RepID=UPI001B88A449|nr:vacuolar segregation protein PEP7-like isoform X2 [Gigantopelta aegis]